MRYPCELCEYSSTNLFGLNKLTIKYEGVRYPCEQCEYSATELSYLKINKQSKHENMSYPCDLCE